MKTTCFIVFCVVRVCETTKQIRFFCGFPLFRDLVNHSVFWKSFFELFKIALATQTSFPRQRTMSQTQKTTNTQLNIFGLWFLTPRHHKKACQCIVNCFSNQHNTDNKVNMHGLKFLRPQQHRQQCKYAWSIDLQTPTIQKTLSHAWFIVSQAPTTKKTM